MDELQSLVALFQPKHVVPNTVNPRLQGVDWLAMLAAFSSHLHDEDIKSMWIDIENNYPDLSTRECLLPPLFAIPAEQDVSVENFVTPQNGSQKDSEPVSKREQKRTRLISLVSEAAVILWNKLGIKLPPLQKDQVQSYMRVYDHENSSECEEEESDNEGAHHALHAFISRKNNSIPSIASVKCGLSPQSLPLRSFATPPVPNVVFNAYEEAVQKDRLAQDNSLSTIDTNAPLNLKSHQKRSGADKGSNVGFLCGSKRRRLSM